MKKDVKLSSSASSRIKAQVIKATGDEPTKEGAKYIQLNTPYLPFFFDSQNSFPNDVALRYRRSSTMGAIINSKVNYSVGTAYEWMQNDKVVEPMGGFVDLLNRMNLSNDNFRQVFKDALLQWILQGNLFVEVIRKGSQANIYIKDTTECRLSKNETEVYLSPYWREIKNNTAYSPYPKPEIVPLWDGKKDTKQSHFIIHLKRLLPEYKHYGLPDHVATFKDADIEYAIDTYNTERLKNGFFPSVLVSMYGTPPEGMSDEEYVRRVEQKFGGYSQSGKALFQLLDSKEQRADITEFSGAKEGEFIALEESAKKGIITGNRWFVELSGIEMNGKFGSTKELDVKWQILMNNLIAPDYQQPVKELFETIFKILGFDYKLWIINKSPFNIAENIKPEMVLTINEQRDLLGFEAIEGGDVLLTIKDNGNRTDNSSTGQE
jgi:hypothetical protein